MKPSLPAHNAAIQGAECRNRHPLVRRMAVLILRELLKVEWSVGSLASPLLNPD
jgi:hypothetical protein